MSRTFQTLSLSRAPRVEKVYSWAIGNSFGGGARDRSRAVADVQYLSGIDSGREREGRYLRS